MNKESIANTILEYETKFNGSLINGYENHEEFLNDLNKEIKTNGVNELLEYYRTFSRSMNNTNSTSEKRLAIQDLISVLYLKTVIKK